jgi:hypothetical protein
VTDKCEVCGVFSKRLARRRVWLRCCDFCADFMVDLDEDRQPETEAEGPARSGPKDAPENSATAEAANRPERS